MKVLQFPLARVSLFFIAGILTGHFLQPAPMPVLIVTAIGAIGFGLSYYLTHQNQKFRMLFGTFVFASSFFTGLLVLTLHNPLHQKSHYIHQLNDSKQDHELELILRERLRASAKNSRYIAIVNRIDGKPCAGRILINFRSSEISNTFPIGTNLKITGKVFLHRKADNPDQFDYGQYLTNKSILAQLYVRSGQVQIGREPTKDLFYYSDALRRRILRNMEAAHFPAEELAVVAALILGQQQDISKEVLQDYQYAGAIHILSVSGLHVGFIVLFLNFLLGYLPKNKMNSYISLAVLFGSLWGFAILAGLSPSVIRSATMFSFVALGMHLRRKTNVFHTLLVSLFLILLFEPSFLFDVGFQLSYLALFFILWLQPLLAALWIPKFKMVNYFWQIMTVSFAAQVGTLPLSLYYFHQFPGLFFVTNLIIIPFVSFIMACGVLLMVLAAFNWIPVALAVLLDWSIRTLNQIIATIASFEHFIFKDIAFNIFMLLSLYLLILSMRALFPKPDFKRIGLSLMALLLFQLSYFLARWSARSQKEWIVFNVSKSTMITERNGEAVTVYGNGELKTDRLKPYLVANFCRISAILPLRNKMYWNATKILLVDSLAAYPKHAPPDILLLRQSPKLNLDRMLQECRPKQIVADASNFKSYVRRWERTCLKAKIPFHATAEKGFYKLKN